VLELSTTILRGVLGQDAVPLPRLSVKEALSDPADRLPMHRDTFEQTTREQTLSDLLAADSAQRDGGDDDATSVTPSMMSTISSGTTFSTLESSNIAKAEAAKRKRAAAGRNFTKSMHTSICSILPFLKKCPYDVWACFVGSWCWTDTLAMPDQMRATLVPPNDPQHLDYIRALIDKRDLGTRHLNAHRIILAQHGVQVSQMIHELEEDTQEGTQEQEPEPTTMRARLTLLNEGLFCGPEEWAGEEEKLNPPSTGGSLFHQNFTDSSGPWCFDHMRELGWGYPNLSETLDPTWPPGRQEELQNQHLDNRIANFATQAP